VETSLAPGRNTLKILLRNDFAVTYEASLPALASASQGLRIVSETWSDARDVLTLQTIGLAGHTYEFAVLGKEQIRSIDGARLAADGSIEEIFPAANGAAESQNQTVTIRFLSQAKKPSQNTGLHN
jgi:hypothetical protein